MTFQATCLDNSQRCNKPSSVLHQTNVPEAKKEGRMMLCVLLKHTPQVTKQASSKTHYSTIKWYDHLEKQPSCPQSVAHTSSMRSLCEELWLVPKKQGSGGTEAKNSVWEWGEARLHPFPGPPVLMADYANPKYR